MFLLDMVDATRDLIGSLEDAAMKLPQYADDIGHVVRNQRQLISYYAERMKA